MTDAPAQPQSYVDNYQPPSPVAGGGMPFQNPPNQAGTPIQPKPPTVVTPEPMANFAQQQPVAPVSPSPSPSQPYAAQSVTPPPVMPQTATPQPPAMPQPAAASQPTPMPQPVPSVPSRQSSSGAASENLEDQNIFDLLGVTNASETEKEAFLDELQQVIWEDFLENDVKLLITDEEMTQLRQIMADNSQDQLAQQEAVITFLEKLVPDLEEIMLEKALELKADMVKERIAGMREYFANQPEKISQVDKAASLIQDDQWQSATQTLNSIN